VRCAASGQEALEALREADASHSPFELCLLALRMPRMNGIETVLHINREKFPSAPPIFLMVNSRDRFEMREQAESAGILGFMDKAGVDKLPILAMTALAMKDDREKIMNAGMNGHITKPIDIDELISVLGQWLPPEMRRVEANNYSSSLKTSCSLSLKTSCSPSLKTSGDIDPYHQVSSLQIPGLDVTAGLHRLNGNHELYLSLLNKFAENDDYVITREQVLSDPELAHRKAHSIRSIAGNLGGTELASVAAGLEKTLRDGKGYEDYLQQFIELNNALRAAIAAIVPQRKDSTYTESLKPMGTVDNLRQLLSQLRNPVTYNEPMACKEILKLLQANRWPDETVADIAELNRSISKYRFDEATKTIDILMESIEKI
jgi:CheY-like chemotaxis protein